MPWLELYQVKFKTSQMDEIGRLFAVLIICNQKRNLITLHFLSCFIWVVAMWTL